MTTSSAALARIVRGQAGVLSRRQAFDIGLSRDQIRHRLVTGEWIRVHPGVYRLAAAVPSAEASLRAASLWVDGRGVLSDCGAAWWWKMTSDAPSSWVFVTGQGYALQPGGGVRVARCFVDPRDTTTVFGVPVLTRPLAVLSAAVTLERRRPATASA